MAPLTSLAPFGDELIVIVMGPGNGESVLIRWPPDHWLVVDSFDRSSRDGKVHPAAEALDHFNERADLVALTHPHEDHTKGFAALIDRRKPDGRVGWWPEEIAGPRWATDHAGQALRKGANEHAIAAIVRTWGDEPASRWELLGDSPPVEVGDATIDVLAPSSAAIDASRTAARPDYNEMSSAMLVTWHDCRVLLGADLVNRHGWDDLHTQHGDEHFAQTQVLKIAHHGSKEAQHSIALGRPPARDRTLMGSPYNRGGKVPDYGAGEDVSGLLAVAHNVLLSAHHGVRPDGAGTHSVSRSQLAPADLVVGPIAISLDPAPPDLHECWVASRWSPDGSLIGTARGDGSVSVVA